MVILNLRGGDVLVLAKIVRIGLFVNTGHPVSSCIFRIAYSTTAGNFELARHGPILFSST